MASVSCGQLQSDCHERLSCSRHSKALHKTPRYIAQSRYRHVAWSKARASPFCEFQELLATVFRVLSSSSLISTLEALTPLQLDFALTPLCAITSSCDSREFSALSGKNVIS
jgi:hypothetical protein